ncbi:MAG: glycosyltransferase family 4 protein [Candidatus Vogelbacteria bacterium]|nr:glycosyltransferase family 4 protein [Candidatus Vogelbacteria bacterium]
MRIGIVLHPYGESAPAGLARIIVDLADALTRLDNENEYIIYLKDEPIERPRFHGNRWRIEVLGGGMLWLERGLRCSEKSDVYLFNTPVLPLSWRPAHSVVLALDFAYIHFPARGIFGRMRSRFLMERHRRGLSRADAIIAISRESAREVLRYGAVEERKLHVVYPGFKNLCGGSEGRANLLDLPQHYILSVGVIKERKNLMNTLRAFRILSELPKFANHKLVVVGRRTGEYAKRAEALAQEPGLEGRVIWLDHISDDKLGEAYSRAGALSFPSLLEGFGFPVLEAFACGTPVVTSDRSSLVEIAGDAALTVDPFDPRAIANALQKVALEGPARTELVRRGTRRAKEFSWRKTAEAVDHILRSVVAE